MCKFIHYLPLLCLSAVGVIVFRIFPLYLFLSLIIGNELKHVVGLSINYLCIRIKCACGPGSVDSIATGYVLDGPRIESRWGRDFSRLSRAALEPTQPAVQLVPGLFRG
jgi:hypothetical protein